MSQTFGRAESDGIRSAWMLDTEDHPHHTGSEGEMNGIHTIVCMYIYIYVMYMYVYINKNVCVCV